jgi:hypothetical protein
MGVETGHCPGTPDAEDDEDRSRLRHDDQPTAIRSNGAAGRATMVEELRSL